MTSTSAAKSAPVEHRVIQRLLMPLEPTPDVLPLYIEGTPSRAATSASAVYTDSSGATRSHEAQSQTSVVDDSTLGAEESFPRHGARIPAGEMRSFGTYFNAFPAGYWRRWTPVRKLRLTIVTRGAGRLIVFRSNARGSFQRQDFAQVQEGDETTSIFDLPLTAFGDGGWYWFDAYSGAGGLEIISAEWSADASLARQDGTFSLAMTTMNKVEYVLENLKTICEATDLRAKLDALYIVDQGSDRLREHAEQIAPYVEAMGDQLRIIEQGNIGGSGGFSRGLYEGATNGRSAYAITCDDDVAIEPESILRMATFADFATKPTLVGAHMFDINNRSVLHAFGEKVDRWTIQQGTPSAEAVMGHDLAAHPLRETAWMHRRADVDYNGWWMCLIPTEVLREIGLALPVFIKWDDTEYGLRAKKAGYPTVSLPGAGTWHVSWTDKNDAIDWQAYFHQRNRLITALLHSPYTRGGGVVLDSQGIDLKHTLSMQYSTELVRLLAQEDLLRGPEVLHEEIGTKLPQVRAILAEHTDAAGKADPEDFPEVNEGRPPNKGRPITAPRRVLLPLWMVKSLAKQTLKPVREESRKGPQGLIPAQDAQWWTLSAYDSALVSNAEGSKMFWYKRDPKLVRSLLARGAAAHMELTRRWPELQRRYREAAAELASFEAWERTFAANAVEPAVDPEQAPEEGRTA